MNDEEPFLVPQGRDPAPLRALLREVVRGRGWSARLEGARIHERWGEIAGEQVAGHTEPVRLVRGVLVVRADSGTWATQVRYLGAQLAARANEVLGPGQVRQVKVISGALRRGGVDDGQGSPGTESR